MMGAFAGISMSCPPAILRKWVPADERGTLVGGALSGGTFGVIVAMPLSGVIVERLGWEALFYVFGALSLLWGLLWFLFARESPDQMTWINSDELAYIKSKSLPYWVVFIILKDTVAISEFPRKKPRNL